VDELWSGVAVTGAPSVERELGLSHARYGLFAFALPLILAAALEAGIAARFDAGGRGKLVVLGQGALAIALALTAWTASPWGLTVGLALAGASSGVACGAAQAMLVAGRPDDTDRLMVRWSIFCAVGDVLTPLVTAGAVALGHSYRAAMLAIALVVAAQCLVSAALVGRSRANDETPEDDEPPAEPLRAAISRGARLPRLWLWLFAAASCTLLDELVLALAALRMEHDQGARAAVATCSAVAFSAGALTGGGLTDRAVAASSRATVLVVSSIFCALAVALLVASGSVAATFAALFLLGVTCAPHHPLAFASAYRELPRNPGTVQAMAQLFVVIDVVAPLALGTVADRVGLRAAMACLLLQPAVVLLAVAVARSSRGALSQPVDEEGDHAEEDQGEKTGDLRP